MDIPVEPSLPPDDSPTGGLQLHYYVEGRIYGGYSYLAEANGSAIVQVDATPNVIDALSADPRILLVEVVNDDKSVKTDKAAKLDKNRKDKADPWLKAHGSKRDLATEGDVLVAICEAHGITVEDYYRRQGW
jgi:hypothetical protein